MNDASKPTSGPSSSTLSLSVLGRVDDRCDRFESSWKTGERPRIEDALDGLVGEDRAAAFRGVLALELELLKRAGERPVATDYYRRFSEYAGTIRQALSEVESDGDGLFDGKVDASGATLEIASPFPDTDDRERTVGDVSAASDPFPAGTVIADHEIIDRLGRGGMGVVYRARHRRAGRVVALKLIQPGQLADIDESQRRGILERFQAESRAAAGLEHDHIVTVYDVGQVGDLPYYSMRLIERGSLADRLRGGPIDCRKAANWLEPIARALQHAHDRGILHRDVKPRNILIDSSDRALITDFGLVKRLNAAQAWKTLSGERLGTPSYMSPEQADGKREVGRAADIYGLGATLYETLTGRPPFQGADPVQTLRLVIDTDPVSPRRLNPAVPKDLETICLKCLEKDPRRRYATADALAEDLRRWLNREPIAARPVGRVGCLVRWARRKPTLAAVSAALILTAVASAMAIGWQYRATVQVQRDLIDAHVAGLVRAEPAEIPRILTDLETLSPTRAEVLQRLRRMFDESEPRGRRRVRAALAISRLDPARVDPALIDELREEMLKADPRELILIRSVLKPWGKALRDGLWSIVDDPFVDPRRGFRAACGLAELDPQGSPWSGRGEDVAARLLSREGTRLDAWIEALRPVRAVLRPFLEKTFADPARADRFAAAAVLAAYADQPEHLIPLVDQPETDPRQLKSLLPRLRELDRGRVVGLLEERLANLAEQPRLNPSSQRRLAHLAAVLLALDHAEPAWRLLRLVPDPDARTTLIHAFAPADIDPLLLIRRLDVEPDVSARRALLLALGEYDIPPIARRFPSDRQDAFRGRLAKLYRDEPDPGLHAAVAWLARRWGLDEMLHSIDRELVSDLPKGKRDWYVNREGMGFAVVRGPVEIDMSGITDQSHTLPMPPRRMRIPREFAIGMLEVDNATFTRLLTAKERGLLPEDVEPKRENPSPRAAVDRFDWVTAAKFCRRLSELEGFPEREMCFPPADQINLEMNLPLDILSRAGYRFPTDAEWEFAARAGTSSLRYFGASTRLSAHYAWTIENAAGTSRPVGLLKPNDLGLFDVLGNADEWCQNGYSWYQRFPHDGVVDDVGDLLGPVRVRRGANVVQPALSATYRSRGATHDYPAAGLRIARTIRVLEPSPSTLGQDSAVGRKKAESDR